MAAFDPATLDRWRALAIVDRDGTTVGTISEFYLDRETGYPTWALVDTGLFGATQTFVPLVHATEISDGLQVPYEKRHIKDAPRVDLHDELTPDEEATLFAHYGVEYQPSPDPTAPPDEEGEAGPGEAGETAEAEAGEAAEVEADEGAGPGPAEQGAMEGPGPVPAEPGAVEGPGPVPAEPGAVEGPEPVPAEPGTVEGPGAVPEPASAEDPAAAPSEPGSAEGPGPAAAETGSADRYDEPAASGSTQPDPDPYAAPEPGSGFRETTGGLPDEPGTAGRDEPVAAGPDDATLVAPGGFGSASEPRGAQADPDAPRDARPDPDVDPSQAPPADPDLSRTAPVEPGLPGSTAASPGPVPTTIDKDDGGDPPRRAADEPSWPPGFDESAPAERPAASERWREAKLAAERNRIARAAAAAQPEERSPLERARRRLERLVGVGQDHPDPDDVSADREDAERARRARLGLEDDDPRRR
jgi:PRC-barrel domain